ncbi:MAG: hypothetical protein ACK5SZ_02105, partial [bacterium]
MFSIDSFASVAQGDECSRLEQSSTNGVLPTTLSAYINTQKDAMWVGDFHTRQNSSPFCGMKKGASQGAFFKSSSPIQQPLSHAPKKAITSSPSVEPLRS